VRNHRPGLPICATAMASGSDDPDPNIERLAAACDIDAGDLHFDRQSVGSLGPVWIYTGHGYEVDVGNPYDMRKGHEAGWTAYCADTGRTTGTSHRLRDFPVRHLPSS
jgi:hypothetical protein